MKKWRKKIDKRQLMTGLYKVRQSQTKLGKVRQENNFVNSEITKSEVKAKEQYVRQSGKCTIQENQTGLNTKTEAIMFYTSKVRQNSQTNQ